MSRDWEESRHCWTEPRKGVACRYHRTVRPYRNGQVSGRVAIAIARIWSILKPLRSDRVAETQIKRPEK